MNPYKLKSKQQREIMKQGISGQYVTGTDQFCFISVISPLSTKVLPLLNFPLIFQI